MLAIERQREIVLVLTAQRSVRVGDLAGRFQVTEETIRRDLDKLEAQGKLVRSHGGAVAAMETEQPHWQREFVNQGQKEAIAREAVKLVEPGDSLILDASSSSWFLARRLPDMPLTIITNSLYICMSLQEREHITVICPGGTLAATSMSFIGAMTLENLRRYHAAKMFFSCRGLDIQRGLSDLNEDQAMVRRIMLDVSDEHILLLDSSKWGTRALSMVAPLGTVQRVITDADVPPAEVEAVRAQGIVVDLATVHLSDT
jgi:DeoR/GlpR family transcriptional regulator of sugar metabolism